MCLHALQDNEHLCCFPSNDMQSFPDIFVDFHFMKKAILANQCMFVCIPHLCSSLCVCRMYHLHYEKFID